VDPEAEFLFVPADQVIPEANRLSAIPFDVPGVELGHHGKECSFEAIIKKYGLTADPALRLLGKIVNGADTDNTLWHQPEAPGLNAIAEGFRHLGFPQRPRDQCCRVDRLRRVIRVLQRDGKARKAAWRFHRCGLKSRD
jgi:hypothetical protein